MNGSIFGEHHAITPTTVNEHVFPSDNTFVSFIYPIKESDEFHCRKSVVPDYCARALVYLAPLTHEGSARVKLFRLLPRAETVNSMMGFMRGGIIDQSEC